MDRKRKKHVLHSSTLSLNHQIALTTGDPCGIGKFAAKEALRRLGPKKQFQFLVWTDPKEKIFKVPGFQTSSFKSISSALKEDFCENIILQIKSQGGPGKQLLEAGELCLHKKASALITGPVRKKLLEKWKARGQTDLLKKLCKTKMVFMCFRGTHFNTILWTDHIPLKQVSINQKDFKNFLHLALDARALLKKNLRELPLGVLGLNPHAGEKGLIGKEEELFIGPSLKSFSKKNVEGPLSPDTAFLKKNWKKYSFFIALYHDQGLIPFKAIHSHTGFVHTLGLPFLRLGVSHGTGADLKKSNVSCDSFFSAIKELLHFFNKK